jgi:hypothetical protein
MRIFPSRWMIAATTLITGLPMPEANATIVLRRVSD